MSERIFVVVDGGKVTNSIVADDDFAALIAPEHDAVVEVTNRVPQPGIGWDYMEGHLVAPQPFPSWTLDSSHDWQPPTPMPETEGMWAWDEPTLSWVDMTPAE